MSNPACKQPERPSLADVMNKIADLVGCPEWTGEGEDVLESVRAFVGSSRSKAERDRYRARLKRIAAAGCDMIGRRCSEILERVEWCHACDAGAELAEEAIERAQGVVLGEGDQRLFAITGPEMLELAELCFWARISLEGSGRIDQAPNAERWRARLREEHRAMFPGGYE